MAFIGSGPLPLTSILLLSYFPYAKIHNIDRDADALRQSQALVQRLGYASCMTSSCEDATSEAEASNWEQFNVVFLAALVGMTSAEKMRILGGLARKLKSGCLLVCRSARGMREVLYPVRLSQVSHFIVNADMIAGPRALR
jgi:nicotianamine synthase